MKYKHPQYNFIKDPHLAYFIQSPYKIAQLLKTKQYKLQNNQLIQIETNHSIQIDPYVLKRLNLQQIQRVAEQDSLNYKINELLQKQSILNEKLQQLKTHKNNQSFRKASKSPPNVKKLNKNEKNSISLPHIKGLKEFKMKIL